MHVWAAELKGSVKPGRRGGSPRLLTPSLLFTIDMDTIIQQMRHFHQSPTTAALRERISRKSLLDIWGVGRRENGHSNFLAWLLSPEESHDLGHFALQKLLLLLATCRLTPEQQLPGTLQHAILSGKRIIRTAATVEREVSIPPNGRVDIVATIELNQELAGIRRLQIVLENKIDAAETDSQTIRYYQHFSAQKEEGLYPIYVYLSPRQAQSCKDTHFIRIDYQQILDFILSPALQRQNMPEYTRILLQEYVSHLSYFNSESLYIAMNEQQRSLLIKFWEENSALILACAQAISEDPDASPEVQESARAIVEQGKKVNQRDRAKYVCQNSAGRSSGPMGKGRIVLYVIKNYAEETDCTYEQLKQTFAPRWFEELRNLDLNARPKRYFIADDELITLKSGEAIAVSSQCGGGTSLINFDEFVKIAEKLGFVIRSQQL